MYQGQIQDFSQEGYHYEMSSTSSHVYFFVFLQTTTYFRKSQVILRVGVAHLLHLSPRSAPDVWSHGQRKVYTSSAIYIIMSNLRGKIETNFTRKRTKHFLAGVSHFCNLLFESLKLLMFSLDMNIQEVPVMHYAILFPSKILLLVSVIVNYDNSYHSIHFLNSRARRAANFPRPTR